MLNTWSDNYGKLLLMSWREQAISKENRIYGRDAKTEEIEHVANIIMEEEKGNPTRPHRPHRS